MDKKLGDLYKIECDDTMPENEVDLKDSSGKIIGKVVNTKPMQVKTLRHNSEVMESKADEIMQECFETAVKESNETDTEFIERIKKIQSPSRKCSAIDRVYNAGEAFIKGFNSGLDKE